MCTAHMDSQLQYSKSPWPTNSANSLNFSVIFCLTGSFWVVIQLRDESRVESSRISRGEEQLNFWRFRFISPREETVVHVHVITNVTNKWVKEERTNPENRVITINYM